MPIRSRHSARPLRRLAPVAPVRTLPLARSTRRRRLSLHDARRVSMCALAMGSILCAGALLAGPVVAAPVSGSDENGPLVQIIRPGYNDVLKGKYRILIAVTAKKYNPQSVEMFVDDKSATGGPVPLSSLASSSFDWDTRSFGDGKHKLSVRVTDAQGFRGWAEVTVFVNNGQVVDSSPPDLKWVGIAPFQQFSGQVQLEVGASDNFGVKLLQIFINPIDAPNRTPAMYSWLLNQPPYRVNLDTIGKRMPDGLYSIKALAYDSSDQQGEAPPLTIGIVNNAIDATTIGEMLQDRREMAGALNKTSPGSTSPLSTSSAPKKLVLPSTPAATPSSPAAATPNASPLAAQPATPLATPLAPSNPGINVPILTPPSALADQSQAPLANVPDSLDSESAELRASLPSVETLSSASLSKRPAPAADPLQLPVPGEFAPDPAPEQAPTSDSQSSQTSPNAQAVTPTESSSAAPAVASPNAVSPNAEVPAAGVPTAGSPDAKASGIDEVAPVASPTETPLAQTPLATTAPTVSDAVSSASIAGDAESASSATSATQTPSVAAPAPSDSSTSVPAMSDLVTSGTAYSEARASATQAPSLPAPVAPTRLAELPRPVGARFSGAPGLSRFSALDAQISASEAGVAAPQSARSLDVARLSLPGLGARRFVGGSPVLSQTASGDASRISRLEVARRVRLAEPAPLALSPAMSGIARAVRVSAPTMMERALSQPSKLVRETQAKSGAQTQARRAASVNPSKAVAAKARPKPIEIAPYAPTTPRLSAPSAPGVAGEISPLAKATPRVGQGPRISALPRPDANDARAERRNAITIVPVQTPLQVEAIEVPASFQVERTMSLRAVAARFNLPVELVALSNDWPADMKLLKGMTVRLPRPLQVSYNGAPVQGEVPSMLLGDTGVTAFRFLFEQSGGKLQWDAKNQRVVARKGDQEITLNIGSKIAKVGDKEVAMELAAFLFEGRTMVPVRFFEESLNAQVDWNPQTGRLVVAMAG